MTLTRGFVRNAVTTPLDTRLMDMAKVVCNRDGSPRVGVLSLNDAYISPTNILTPKATMHVTVAAIEIVASKGKADGVTIFTNDGATDVAIAAAPASNSRITVVWAKHNDDTTGDANALPVFGTTDGTAAAVPTKPAIPTGATELGMIRVFSGTTAANGGSNVTTDTAQMTAMRGGVVRFRTKADLDLWTSATAGQPAFVLGGDGYVWDGSLWVPNSGFILVGLAKGTTSVTTGASFTNLNSSNGVGTNVRQDAGYSYGAGAVTVPKPGYYGVSVQINVPSSATGTQRGFRITSGGNTYATDERRHTNLAQPQYVTLAVAAMPISGSFEIGVRHDIGTTQNYDIAAITVVYLGPL